MEALIKRNMNRTSSQEEYERPTREQYEYMRSHLSPFALRRIAGFTDAADLRNLPVLASNDWFGPPVLRGVNTLVAVIYYDIKRPGRPNKRILLLPEFHEVTTQQTELARYLTELINYTDKRDTCLDVHVEAPPLMHYKSEFVPIDSIDAAVDTSDLPPIESNQTAGGGDLSATQAITTYVESITDLWKKGYGYRLRLHFDDIRGFTFNDKSIDYVRHKPIWSFDRNDYQRVAERAAERKRRRRREEYAMYRRKEDKRQQDLLKLQRKRMRGVKMISFEDWYQQIVDSFGDFAPDKKAAMEDYKAYVHKERYGDGELRVLNFDEWSEANPAPSVSVTTIEDNDRLTRDDYLALAFGIGPSADGRGRPNAEVRRRFELLDGITTTMYRLDWAAFGSIRVAARKSLREFSDQHSVDPKTLLSAFRSAMAYADVDLRSAQTSGGTVINAGKSFAAIGDIYAFLRMFRTFSKKTTVGTRRRRRPRVTPCEQEDQTNVIYCSHLSHTSIVMLLIWKVFGVEPAWYQTTRSARTKQPIVPEIMAAIKKVRSNTKNSPSPSPNFWDWPRSAADRVLMAPRPRGTVTDTSPVSSNGKPPPPFFPMKG